MAGWTPSGPDGRSGLPEDAAGLVAMQPGRPAEQLHPDPAMVHERFEAVVVERPTAHRTRELRGQRHAQGRRARGAVRRDAIDGRVADADHVAVALEDADTGRQVVGIRRSELEPPERSRIAL